MSTINVICKDIDYNNPGNYCKAYDRLLTGDNKQDCQSRIQYGICQSKVNDCILAENAKVRTTYDSLKDKAQNDRIRATQAQYDWDNRKNQIKNELLREDKYMGRDGCGINKGCRDVPGWHWAWNNNYVDWGVWCEQVCRRNDDTAETDALTRIINEKGYRPLDGPPTPNEPSYYQLLKLATISCCNNIVNIVNGEVKNTNITQQCVSKGAGDTPATTITKPTTTTTTTTPTTTPTTINPNTSIQLIGGGENNKGLIISIIIALSCVSLSMILLLLLVI